MPLLPILAAWLAASPAGAASGLPLDPVEAIETGDWNERMRAVRVLGARGRDSLRPLRSALADPDWQIRLTAGHWLARLDDREALEDALSVEECPAVRMGLAHWLGGMDAGGAEPPPAGFAEDPGRCESWFWPDRRGGGSWLRPPKRTAATRPAEGGCQYIHYHRPGTAICPEGTRLRGVGPSPHTVKFLEGRPPESGVALCCPSGEPRAAVVAPPPEPVEAECRLMPLQCPPPFVEMEPREGFFSPRKGREYRRTRRHKEGDIVWVHCCKAPQAPAAGAVPPPAVLGATAEGPTGSPRAEEITPPEPLPAAAAEEEPPERAIALAALEKSERSLRLSEIEELLSGEPEALPRPLGPGSREEEEYAPPAPPPEAPERAEEPLSGVEPLFEGRVEPLPPPERPLPGDGAIRAAAIVEPDRGRPEVFDPLPELLKLLKSRRAAARARAADQIGALGAAGAPAVPLLKTALRDPSPRVRSSAALALGNVTRGGDAAVAALKAALKDKHVAVRYGAAQALGRVGTPAARRAFRGHLHGMTRGLLRE